MVRASEVLLNVWREACQHSEIQESTDGIGQLLQAHLPLDRLEVVRLEAEPAWLASVALFPRQQRATSAVQTELTADEFQKLVQWVRRGKWVKRVAGSLLPAVLAPLLSRQTAQDLVAMPLVHGTDTLGLLLIAIRDATRLSPRREALLQALQEPFAAALANDRRLHELAALRDAAEADRRSLLRRLGRTNLSERIVGMEGGLAQVMKRVEQVGQSDAPVLLLGETGTGKEVIARAIHDRSDRRDGPFIRVNCGAIPRELIDSQLFGHEKGAFTGASEVRRGWFERADGGTLFLDEIGELPADAQVRFLRVLQDRFIERVGGSDMIRVDVRVVAATHRDLAGMVQEGRFREDLWYRIAVFPILLPPLRERLQDIADLAAHFVERAATRFGLAQVPITRDDIALLSRYHWPGNIRELAAVIDRAAILGEGQSLQIEAALGFAHTSPPPADPGRLPTSPDGTLLTLDEAVRAHVEVALRRTHGRVEGRDGAAAMLQINPHTLRARMRKLKIEWGKFRE